MNPNLIKFSANRVWRTYLGGMLLDKMVGKVPAEDSHFPEDWIGSMVVANNVGREHISEGLAMVTLDDGQQTAFKTLIETQPDYFLGNTSITDMPLVKYLDSATRLHFQAHPTREFAQQRLQSPRGKTEAYVILDIREDVTEPYIYAGFQRSPTRETLKEWIETQNISAIESCFDKIPVKKGDVFLLPGGRPHALGEGILMLEIMEPSDLAVRFEFERCGYVIPEEARFMKRDIETALDVFNFDPVPPENIDSEFRCLPITEFKDNKGNGIEELIGPTHTDCFVVKSVNVNTVINRKEPSCFFGIVTQGNGHIQIGDEIIRLSLWERFFIPAGVTEFSYLSDNNMCVLECYPGKEKD